MKPLVLVTNDDGVFSPGLAAAVNAAAPLGDLLIVAPRVQQTSMSRAFPWSDDGGTIDVVKIEVDKGGVNAYAVNGSPALAVSHAMLEIAPRIPDLCISGVNYGENVGSAIFASGTVGAALEASTYSVPALAVSLEAKLNQHRASTYSSLDWTSAIHFTRYFAAHILTQGLPQEIAALNVNIPWDATPSTPIRRTKHSRQSYIVFAKPKARDFATPLRFELEVQIEHDTLEPDSDICALILDRVVSVTPLGWSINAVTSWGSEYR